MASDRISTSVLDIRIISEVSALITDHVAQSQQGVRRYDGEGPVKTSNLGSIWHYHAQLGLFRALILFSFFTHFDRSIRMPQHVKSLGPENQLFGSCVMQYLLQGSKLWVFLHIPIVR